MNKRIILKKIIAKLTSELEVYFRAAQYARAEATHEQNKAENKYDTRGLEASYLARGQSRQAAELEAAIEEFDKLDGKKFENTDGIGVGALVELALDREQTFYFIGSRAGGTEIVHDKKEILVITPQSPLGEQLQGKKAGETFQVKLGGETRAVQVIAVQ